MSDSRLLIGQLASKVGMAPSALRYYEEAGLLTPTERTPAGCRLYRPEIAGRIRFIQHASALGLTLTEIRDLIQKSRDEPENELSLLQALLSAKIDETRAKMAELTNRANELLRVERELRQQPPPAHCHLGDCTCWFPDAA
jgi:DNA-binding transcriptional MerR regulator